MKAWSIDHEALAEGLKAVNTLIAKVAASGISSTEKVNVLHELEVKRVQCNDALVAALHLKMTAEAAITTPTMIAEAAGAPQPCQTR